MLNWQHKFTCPNVYTLNQNDITWVTWEAGSWDIKGWRLCHMFSWCSRRYNLSSTYKTLVVVYKKWKSSSILWWWCGSLLLGTGPFVVPKLEAIRTFHRYTILSYQLGFLGSSTCLFLNFFGLPDCARALGGIGGSAVVFSHCSSLGIG